jgi:hypothetical protein
MALNQKVLQKKRAKKAEQRKASKNQARSASGILSFSREWAASAQAPIADVLVPKTLFDTGMGNVWFSRQCADGRYALSIFLVDTYCLGIKNALYAIVTPSDYTARLDHLRRSFGKDFEREHPAYARKLVERAVAYARDLGFDPHPDYHIAKVIFGDADATACPTRLAFGRDGKPFYVCGPNDTPTQQRRILKQLEKRCGSNGFNFLIMDDHDPDSDQVM